MSTESLLTEILVELKKLNGFASRRAESGDAGVATDTELDDPSGRNDPIIKKDFKRWTGPSMVGKHYSETTPEYLDGLASFKDWQAGKDDEANAVDDKGRPKSFYAKKDSKLCRGWAKRLRAGWKPKATTATQGFDSAGRHSGHAAFEDDSFDGPEF